MHSIFLYKSFTEPSLTNPFFKLDKAVIALLVMAFLFVMIMFLFLVLIICMPYFASNFSKAAIAFPKFSGLVPPA
jgi:hypothetical protein